MSNLLVGTKLQSGLYTVGKEIARGGFGIVYNGSDTHLQRRVAIKEFFPEGCTREGLKVIPGFMPPDAFERTRERFFHEARVLARFDHRGIVRVHSVFPGNDTAYMVMEYLQGRTLQGVVEERGALPEAEALRMIREIGAALQVVHAQSLIHRDIKPENVMLCEGDEGRVVLMDFGLNRELAEAGHYGTRRLGLSGAMGEGTPGYAAPEQHGHDKSKLGNHTDVYGLGATLYFLLTGKEPLDAISRYNEDLAPPHLLKPAVSRGVSDAVMKAMEMKIADRPKSVRAFLENTRAFLQGTQAFFDLLQTSIAPNPSLTHHLSSVTPRTMIPATPTRGAMTAFATGEARVAQSGRGDYSRLSAAIKAVAPGTRIVVEAGLYLEPNGIVLDKEVEIIGPGKGVHPTCVGSPLRDSYQIDGAVIVSKYTSCLQVQTDKAVIRGLSLRCNAMSGKRYSAVSIKQGDILLEDCDLSSNDGACLFIQNHISLQVRNCRIHSGNTSGIIIYKSGLTIIEDCDVFGNGSTGITIMEGASPHVRNCRIHDGKAIGIYFCESGLGVVKDCHIFGNASAGMIINTSANPVVSRCCINRNETVAIWVREDGIGVVAGCDLTSNKDGAFDIERGARTILKNNQT